MSRKPRRIYRIDRRKLRFPKEVYRGTMRRLLGIVSPSRMFCAQFGCYGEDITRRIAECEIERIKQRVNERTATRREWARLRHFARVPKREPMKSADVFGFQWKNICSDPVHNATSDLIAVQATGSSE